MNNFGFKIIDDIKIEKEVFELIDYSNKNKLPMELAIYKEDKEMYERIIEKSQYLNTIHLSKNSKLYIAHKTFDQHKHIIFEEIKRGVSYGVYRFVLHPNDYNFNLSNTHYKDKIISLLIERLTEVNEFVNKLNSNKKVEIYIENMFDPIELFKELFKEIDNIKLDNINFCFDIGHAKVWSGTNLEEWIEFLDILKNKYNKKFHFHIHFNLGLGDQHLSFEEAVEQGMEDKDEYFSSSKKITDAIRNDLIDVYKDDTLVMEQNPKYQINGYEMMKNKKSVI